MIMPNNWICPFFITFGACMILTTVTCCLFHLRKTRNQKKEIIEWVNAVKYGGQVYHPLLHWIKNNSDLSIKTRVCCSGNEECKKRKIWKARNILPVRYKKILEEPSLLNREAGDCNSTRIENKPFPKPPVDVASGEDSSLHSSPSNTEKSLEQIFPTSLFLDEMYANIHKYVVELDQQQPAIVCPAMSDSLSSSDNQGYSDSIAARLSDLKPAKHEVLTIKHEYSETPVLSESNSDSQKSSVHSVPDTVSL
ncbi:uncharacterized protein [Heptranchias perlo]|uniref:uncharacterized protein n=1 Tax=Heptranchias perlo TaxID=212740 RepID=UPI00355AB0AB